MEVNILSVFADCWAFSDAEIQQTVQEITFCAVQGVYSQVRHHAVDHSRVVLFCVMLSVCCPTG